MGTVNSDFNVPEAWTSKQTNGMFGYITWSTANMLQSFEHSLQPPTPAPQAPSSAAR